MRDIPKSEDYKFSVDTLHGRAMQQWAEEAEKDMEYRGIANSANIKKIKQQADQLEDAEKENAELREYEVSFSRLCCHLDDSLHLLGLPDAKPKTGQ